MATAIWEGDTVAPTSWLPFVACPLLLFASDALADRYDDCNQTNDVTRQINGCTLIIDRGKRESKDRRFEAYFNRGRAHIRDDDYQPAIADFGKAIELKPRSAEAYYWRGYAHSEEAFDLWLFLDDQSESDEELKAAKSDFDKAIEINPEYADAYLARGETNDLLEDTNAAVADYTRLLEIAPRMADAYVGRGEVYRLSNMHELAIADFTKAIEIEPSASTYKKRARSYAKLDKLDLAIADYTQAIATGSKDEDLYFGRGTLYGDKGRYDLAIEDYTKAIEIKATADTYFNRGLAHAELDDIQAAIADVEKALELDPKSEDVKTTLAKLKAAPAKVEATAKATNRTASEDAEIAFWNSVQNAEDPAMFEAYLDQFPDGIFSALAKIKLKKLTPSQ